MLLAVDIGNTSTKFGIFRGEDLFSRFSIPTTAVDEDASRNIGRQLDHPISDSIICSVVPGASAALTHLLSQKQIRSTVVSNDLDLGLTVNYEPLGALGTDRLVNAFAAAEKYGVSAIVCSMGTATTIDVVDTSRVFLGGIIAPGLKTAAAALRSTTSLLPDITIAKPDELLGTSTESAIRSGIVFGHVAMIEGLIHKIKLQSGGKPLVVATGGFAPLIAELTSIFDHCDTDLTLEGLRTLYGRIVADAAV